MVHFQWQQYILCEPKRKKRKPSNQFRLICLATFDVKKSEIKLSNASLHCLCHSFIAFLRWTLWNIFIIRFAAEKRIESECGLKMECHISNQPWKHTRLSIWRIGNVRKKLKLNCLCSQTGFVWMWIHLLERNQ